MKNKSIVFIAVCMILCMIPSVGMLFFPTTETTENRAMAEAPRLVTEEGTFNKAVFMDFEDYFNEHMALRNPLVYTDALIQTSIFQESNVSGVIDGTDGWLYYSSTVDDYLGTKIMSDRQLYNLAHNFSVVQEYAQERGIGFALTVAPNKNTLYGEHMPYYKSYVVDSRHNAKLLQPYLAQQEIAYLDLFELFEAQDEVLYLKRDSHWNNKGACLAYNGIMDMLHVSHEDYSAAEPKRLYNENGDLNKMLYSFYGTLEENYDYGLADRYAYVNDVKSVEDGWIITENTEATGSLLMFRDSFANTLIPFLSAEFAESYYSKGFPNALERFVETYDPEHIVIEKVERNIAEYLENPPILTPPAAELPTRITIATTDTEILMEDCLNDANYYRISGSVDEKRMQQDSEILVRVDDQLYRAYHTGENGYLLYLKKAAFSGGEVQSEVYIDNGDFCIQALSEQLTLPQ